jgi:hypothetical protein
MYALIQCDYGMSSKSLVKNLPPPDLFKMFHPLHEAGMNNAARKLADGFGLARLEKLPMGEEPARADPWAP